jgi:hypothetical protein
MHPYRSLLLAYYLDVRGYGTGATASARRSVPCTALTITSSALSAAPASLASHLVWVSTQRGISIKSAD